jgi:hypothetical protein
MSLVGKFEGVTPADQRSDTFSSGKKSPSGKFEARKLEDAPPVPRLKNGRITNSVGRINGRPSPMMDVLLQMKVGECREATCSPRTVQNVAMRIRKRFDVVVRFRSEWCRPGWARIWRIE